MSAFAVEDLLDLRHVARCRQRYWPWCQIRSTERQFGFEIPKLVRVRRVGESWRCVKRSVQRRRVHGADQAPPHTRAGSLPLAVPSRCQSPTACARMYRRDQS